MDKAKLPTAFFRISSEESEILGKETELVLKNRGFVTVKAGEQVSLQDQRGDKQFIAEVLEVKEGLNHSADLKVKVVRRFTREEIDKIIGL